MKKTLQPFLQFFSLALLLFVSWLLWPMELDSGVGSGDAVTSVPDYRMRQARYVSVRDGKKDIEFFSTHATFDLVKETMNSDDVTIYFYNPAEEKTLVTAKSGTYLMKPRTFTLEGEVHSISPDGFSLKSEAANYHMNERVMYIPSPLAGESKDGDLKVWGNKGENSLLTNIIKLYGEVQTQHFEKKQGLTKIWSDRAEVIRDDSQINYFQNVKIEQREMTAKGTQASLFFTKAPNSVKYMSVNDDVSIVAKDGRRTRSQVAEFFAPTDSVVLSGFPSLYDGDDAVTGDKITLYRTTGVVEVTATNAAAHEEKFTNGGKSSKNGKTQAPSSSEDDELIP